MFILSIISVSALLLILAARERIMIYSKVSLLCDSRIVETSVKLVLLTELTVFRTFFFFIVRSITREE